jgi:hypothetical protein
MTRVEGLLPITGGYILERGLAWYVYRAPKEVPTR